MKTRNFPFMNVVFILLALSAARAHKNIHRVNKNDLHRIVKSKFKIFFFSVQLRYSSREDQNTVELCNIYNKCENRFLKETKCENSGLDEYLYC